MPSMPGDWSHALERVQADNAQGEYYLPDVLAIIRAGGARVAAHVLEDETELMGINDRVALAQARAVAQARIHESHMRAGVTIVDPSGTVIDADVQIGEDAVIAPFTSLHGATRIGARRPGGPAEHAAGLRGGRGGVGRALLRPGGEHR